MRKLIFIFLSMILFSCNDDKKNSTSNSSELDGRDTVSAENPAPGNIQEERDAVQTEAIQSEKENPGIAVTLNGKYRKVEKGEAAVDCNCNCIEVDFDRPTEWCIDKDKLYITARTQKTGENTAEVYFVSASREIEPDRKMPWGDFDTDVPVATIEFTNGGAELDWLGFSTNGEISTDYALYGKKTLEGTYKKN